MQVEEATTQHIDEYIGRCRYIQESLGEGNQNFISFDEIINFSDYKPFSWIFFDVGDFDHDVQPRDISPGGLTRIRQIYTIITESDLLRPIVGELLLLYFFPAKNK